MTETNPTSSKEVKASFSWRYFLLTAIIVLVPSAVSGVIGYFFNDYVKDKKVIDVSSRSSGNLASIPVSVAGSMDILFPVASGAKEPIKSLVRYDVQITNNTEQGLDDFKVFLKPPEDIELTDKPIITTAPPEVRNAISVNVSGMDGGATALSVSLLNPGQSLNVGYFGYSRTTVVNGIKPLSAVVSRKDWVQRTVYTESYNPGVTYVYTLDSESYTKAKVTTVFGGLMLFCGFAVMLLSSFKFQRFMNSRAGTVRELDRERNDEQSGAQ
jgi:hypothetical protein